MQFKVKAARHGEGLVSLDIDAHTKEDAIRQAGEQGLVVLSLRSNEAFIKLPKLFTSRFSLSLFSQEMLALMDAGLPQVEALETILEKELRKTNRKLMESIIQKLYEGKSLSMALEQFPKEFPPLYLAIIRSSEKTGNITDSLTRYISYQSQIDLIRKKITSASIYPVVLLVAGGLVTLFLMLYVVPKFSLIYQDLGHDLPFLSRMLMQWGQLLGSHRPLVLTSLLVALVSAYYAVKHPVVHAWGLKQIKKLPNVANRIKIYQLARFYRTFGMLLKGGVPIVPALEMVSGLLQVDLREQLSQAIDSIREGKPASVSLGNYGLTTPIALRLLRVGERTGRLDNMADRIAGLYDDDMTRWIDWFTKLFEPLLMGFIGLVIGMIVIMMYFPIFELAGSIQ
jgi:general secretion pathway protein F